MKNKTIKTLVFLTLSIFLLTLTACQHYGERRNSGHESREGLTNHIALELNLNLEQEAHLSEVLSTFEEKREELRRPDELRRIFINQLKKKDLDEALLHREIREFIRELESVSNQFITDLGIFHVSLSQVQREKLVDLIETERRGRHN
jgi:homoaconitase/3-isopropylmalate dehydratase large subunit